MRFVLASALALAVVGPSCSSSTPPTGPTASAVIVARAPASVAARACTGCGASSTDLEAAVDIVVEETAGVAGEVTAIDLVLRNGSVVLAGPGQYNADNVRSFAGGTNRVAPRGSLTIRNVAMHFADTFRGQLPAMWTLVVRFRDDRGNTTSADLFVQVTP